VYHKYRAIFDYFDSLLVGLTTTPKDEIDRNTYRLFDLENRVPTDAYPLEDAVRDGFLVPPMAVSVPLKFQREGITYDGLTEDEKDEWDALEWSEDGEVPDRVEAGAVNKWLFNQDTVDKVLEHLMTRSVKVAGSDRIGKTIHIFDYCQNLEFFSANPETTDGAVGESLGKRLFKARLEVIGEIDKKRLGYAPAPASFQVRDALARFDDVSPEAVTRLEIAAVLQAEVAAMNVNNFVVRPKRRLVEKYFGAEAWKVLTAEALVELAGEVAGLPAELEAEDEEAKRFDLLVLNLQLALLRAEPGFARLRDKVRDIAGLLEEKASIPMVQQQLAFIQEIQAEEWWQDVTVPMLENIRKRLRSLVKLIEKGWRAYSVPGRSMRWFQFWVIFANALPRRNNRRPL
jgi:type I site-specific restriction endonuclease